MPCPSPKEAAGAGEVAVVGNQEAAEVAVFFPFRGRLREEDDVPRRGRGLEPASARVGGVER